MRIRTAPHAGRPELARPKSLEFTYRNRAIGTGISVVPPIGAGSLGVSPVLYPRRCIGLSEPAARNKRKHDDANQSGRVAHSSLPLTLAPTLQSLCVRGGLTNKQCCDPIRAIARAGELNGFHVAAAPFSTRLPKQKAAQANRGLTQSEPPYRAENSHAVSFSYSPRMRSSSTKCSWSFWFNSANWAGKSSLSFSCGIASDATPTFGK
jgi:hypothetical protein